MQKSIGWLAIGGIFSLFAAAEAQTVAPSTATTAFDGTYTLVSSAAGTYRRSYNNLPGQCPERSPGPLIIVQGKGRFTGGGGGHFEGTVGQQGELAMRRIDPDPWLYGSQPGGEQIVNGRIHGDGIVRAHAAARFCSWDLVWQKVR